MATVYRTVALLVGASLLSVAGAQAAEEAAKPIRTARVEAERCVLTFTSAAIEARTLVGEMIPMDGAQPGAGKMAFTIRVPRAYWEATAEGGSLDMMETGELMASRAG